MIKKKIVILGAGLTGLSAAWHLKRRGIKCQVLEKESEIGGLCRSKIINGFTFDYDGHILHFKDAYAFSLVKDLLGTNLAQHQRNSWIYCSNRYIPYPFQSNLFDLPANITKECLLGLVSALNDNNLSSKKNYNFLDWINHTFGRGIAKHFMIPYNAKFWTVPLSQLAVDWFDRFIPAPSMSQIIEGAMRRSTQEFGYNTRFWYPRKGGIVNLPLALADSLDNIYTGSEVIAIDINKKEVLTKDKIRIGFDYLISTIPLPEMPYLIKGIPPNIKALFRKLKWNSIFNLNLGLDKNSFHDKNWIYFPNPEISFFRLGFFDSFSKNNVPKDRSSVYVEVAYSGNKPVNKENIIAVIKNDLKKAGIINSNRSIYSEDINDIEYGYPIFDINYKLASHNILRFLRRNHILSCGRYGSWRYMSMEDCLLEGRAVAKKLS